MNNLLSLDVFEYSKAFTCEIFFGAIKLNPASTTSGKSNDELTLNFSNTFEFCLTC